MSDEQKTHGDQKQEQQNEGPQIVIPVSATGPSIIEETALAKANELERRIILEGAKSPGTFMMPDGRTLAETRKALVEQHSNEGLESAEIQERRMREQSYEGEVKAEDVRVVSNETGQTLVRPIVKEVPTAPEAEGEGTPSTTEETTTAVKAKDANVADALQGVASEQSPALATARVSSQRLAQQGVVSPDSAAGSESATAAKGEPENQ